MAINFPDSPVLNQVFSSAGRRWRWDGTTWISLFDKGNVDISDTPPLNPSLGDLWYDSSTGICFVYYYDGDSFQWTDIGSGGNTTLNPLSSINSPTVNLSHNTTTGVLSADVSSIASFFTGANQSLANSGYQRLPGGLIIQWGFSQITANPITYNFPISFPNQGFQIYVTQDSDPNQPLAGGRIVNTSQFNLRSMSGSTTDGVFWLALGY